MLQHAFIICLLFTINVNALILFTAILQKNKPECIF